MHSLSNRILYRSTWLSWLLGSVYNIVMWPWSDFKGCSCCRLDCKSHFRSKKRITSTMELCWFVMDFDYYVALGDLSLILDEVTKAVSSPCRGVSNILPTHSCSVSFFMALRILFVPVQTFAMRFLKKKNAYVSLFYVVAHLFPKCQMLATMQDNIKKLKKLSLRETASMLIIFTNTRKNSICPKIL